MSGSTVRAERPWRAIAYETDPFGLSERGRKRKVAGRTSAKTYEGLTRFIQQHTNQGHAVDWWVVEPFPGLELDVAPEPPPRAG